MTEINDLKNEILGMMKRIEDETKWMDTHLAENSEYILMLRKEMVRELVLPLMVRLKALELDAAAEFYSWR